MASSSRNKKPIRSWLATAGWGLVTLIILAGLGGWLAYARGWIGWTYHGGGDIHESSATAPVRNILWEPRKLIRPTGEGVGAPGGLVPTEFVLIDAKTPRGDFDIFLLERSREGWSSPRRIAPATHPLNSENDEIDPALSANGRTLYFASNRDGGMGGFDLYQSRLGDEGWGAPESVGRRVNSPFDEVSPALHPSGDLLVYATRRPETFLMVPPEDWSDIPLERWSAQPHELVYALRVEFGKVVKRHRWQGAIPLLAANSTGSEIDPQFSPTGDFLYFSSDRPGGLGGFDVYRSRTRVERTAGRRPAILEVDVGHGAGPALNSPADDLAPKVFLEGFALAYRVIDSKDGTATLYESRSREVEAQLEVASIPIHAFARHAWRLALVLATGIGLVGILWLAFRFRHRWTVSLLARCAALAILLHLSMMYGFYFWKVGRNLVALARKEATTTVTVEGRLQAEVTLEATRLPMDLPVPVVRATPQTHAEDFLPDALSAPDLSSDLPVAPMPATAPASATVDAQVAATLSASEPESSPLLVDRPLDAVERATPTPLPEATRLTQADQLPTETEPPAETQSTAPLTVRKDAPAPQEGTVERNIVVKVPSAPAQSETLFTPEARTQVQAPARPTNVLPSLAKHSREAPAQIAELPVPLQAPQQEEITVQPSAPDRALAGRSLPPTPSPTPTPKTTALEKQIVSWEAPPVGVALAEMELEDAREIPRTPLPPSSSPPPLEGTRHDLPDTAVLAEASSRERAAPTDEPQVVSVSSPQQAVSEKLAPALPLGSMPAKALLRGPHPVAEARPLTASSDASAAVTFAASVPLDRLPRPGAPSLPPVRERLPSAARHDPAVKLPEGDQGSEADGGADEIADILTPRRPVPKRAGRAFAPSGPSTSPPPRAPIVQPGGSSRAKSTAGSAETPLANRPPPPPSGRAAHSGSPQPTFDQLTQPPVPLATIEKFDGPRELPEIPPEIAAAEDLGAVRSEPSREVLVERLGGTPESERAVTAALDWLARHQSPDGRWDVEGFDQGCQECRSPGLQPHCDDAVTALALLCFLGQNHTPTNMSSPYRTQVQRAVDWLVSRQTPDGVLAAADVRFTMYGHGMCTLALSETYLLTKDARLLEPLQRAANVILRSQHHTTGGWRYKPEPPLRGDTSISGWQVLALTSLKDSGIEIRERTFDLARHWLDEEVSSGNHGGIYGYSRPNEPRVAMVAEGMYARQLLGSRVGDQNLDESARYIYAETRRRSQLDNLYLLYYGTLALYHYQGWIWERWNKEVREHLVRSQHQRGALAGSWDPTGTWSESGGRVLATALATLSLEVYYRYLPLYWRAERGPTKG